MASRQRGLTSSSGRGTSHWLQSSPTKQQKKWKCVGSCEGTEVEGSEVGRELGTRLGEYVDGENEGKGVGVSVSFHHVPLGVGVSVTTPDRFEALTGGDAVPLKSSRRFEVLEKAQKTLFETQIGDRGLRRKSAIGGARR